MNKSVEWVLTVAGTVILIDVAARLIVGIFNIASRTAMKNMDKINAELSQMKKVEGFKND